MSDTWYSILLIAPAMVIILSFALFPLGYAIDLSFRYADLTSAVGIGPYVGLDNYRFALNDEIFWESARRTLILPIASAPAAVGLVWRYMYHPDFGVYNAIMSILGLPERNWLGAVNLAMPSVIVFDVWQWTPFVALIVLAGLQSLPKEPFEAAELDGASTWQVLRRLTFPMLAPVLTLVFVLRSIDAIRLYDAILSLSHGGPGTATETLTYHLYRIGLKYFKLDHASAISLLFLYVTVIFTGVALRSMMRTQAERARRA
jgi:multiple sugar transport system permease protein